MISKKQKAYEKLCRMFILHSGSFKAVSDATGLATGYVKRIIIELRNMGVDVATGIPTKLMGYSKSVVNVVDINRLNEIVRLTREIKRVNNKRVEMLEDISLLRAKKKRFDRLTFKPKEMLC